MALAFGCSNHQTPPPLLYRCARTRTRAGRIDDSKPLETRADADRRNHTNLPTSATYAYAHLWLRRGLVGRLHDASAAPRLLLTRARHAKPSRTRSPTPSPHEFPFPSPSRESRDAVAGLAPIKPTPPAPIQQSPLLCSPKQTNRRDQIKSKEGGSNCQRR